ncbi:two-component system sensor histidine kinase [Cyclobacterium qasimii M12-11B]|uniref:histidine kinase n=1 Tax=Cyclobacterium qasimii M12-11B TaxID=641524 RepID=S7WPH0_9BACT|nr:two-component system sensor histidine kinase [Cyclobacterium qasimii M12-11B]
MIATVLVVFSLKELKSFNIKTVETSLVTVNKSSHEALKQWVRFRQNTIKGLSKNNFLVQNTSEILLLEQDSASLISSPITSDLREFFQPILSTNEDLGVFLIAPNYVSVFSMRNANTGSLNLMAKENKYLLDKVLLDGETVLIPPIKSDVALDSKYSDEKWHTMFLVTPIINQGNIIAAFSIRLDTKKDFSRILELGRIGETGESYGFNRFGKTVTTSRFEEQLNHTEDLEDVKADSSKSGFTHDLELCKGYALNEIKDQRGKDVYEVCIWDDELNIGITTKIDRAEALKGYLFMRNILIFIILALFTVGFIMINIIINLRQNKENVLVSVKNDLEITVKERTKELQHTIKTKDKFFSILAHDLRSPFSGLLVLLDLLLKNPEHFSETEKTNMLQEIHNSSSQLYKLLENLLSWSRSQTEAIVLNPENVSVWDLIDVNYSLQTQNAKSKK